ncbi:MAG: HNH endonuclease [Clostridia bacterium]|nr:HNH endonuclease [Clostridia bacterium]
MRFSIYQRDGYRCKSCGARGGRVDLEIDHIKPIAKGGKSTYDNLQTLCKRCNKRKGDSYAGYSHF